MITPPNNPGEPGTPFFRDRANRARYLSRVRGWLGTPFHAQGRVKGAGVDCVHLWGEILTEAGHLRDGYAFPEYAVDGGHHSDFSPIEAWLEGHPGFRKIEPGGEIEPGDIVLFRIGRVPWHIAGATAPPEGVHVMEGGVVGGMRFDDATFARRFRGAFRPVFW